MSALAEGGGRGKAWQPRHDNPFACGDPLRTRSLQTGLKAARPGEQLSIVDEAFSATFVLA